MGVSTILFFHAHPDDEASQTSGAMARAVSEGHRVVVVYATNGDHGDAPDDLAEGESVVDRRRSEADASARVLGTARVAWLDYADSGMTGWEQNTGETAFHGADLDEAGQRLADILDEEKPDLTGLRFAVFGMGDSVYGDTYNRGGEIMAEKLSALGAVQVGEHFRHDASSAVKPVAAGEEWAQALPALIDQA